MKTSLQLHVRIAHILKTDMLDDSVKGCQKCVKSGWNECLTPTSDILMCSGCSTNCLPYMPSVINGMGLQCGMLSLTMRSKIWDLCSTQNSSNRKSDILQRTHIQLLPMHLHPVIFVKPYNKYQ